MRISFLAVLLSLVMSSSAIESDFQRQDHAWTVARSQHVWFSINSWGTSSVVFYGPGYVIVPLSFWTLFSLLCALPLGASTVCISAFRRGHERITDTLKGAAEVRNESQAEPMDKKYVSDF